MPSDTALHGKFRVTRSDGSSEPGEPHHGCSYFVIDLVHDPAALPAMEAFVEACRPLRPKLASSIEREILAILRAYPMCPRCGEDMPGAERDTEATTYSADICDPCAERDLGE